MHVFLLHSMFQKLHHFINLMLGIVESEESFLQIQNHKIKQLLQKRTPE